MSSPLFEAYGGNGTITVAPDTWYVGDLKISIKGNDSEHMTWVTPGPLVSVRLTRERATALRDALNEFCEGRES